MSINTLGMIQAAANLANGNGVFCGDPLFLMPDGSFVNKDGVEVYKASGLGLNAYNAFVGYAKNVAASATERGGVIATAKGEGDTVPCKIGEDGKLYVPTYPTNSQYDMTAFIVEIDEVAATLPELPVAHDDGYELADQTTKKIYTLATVSETQTWGDGVALAAGKLYTDGTDLYVFGSGSLAKI